MSNTICRAWMPYLDADIPADIKAPADVAAFELALGCARLGEAAPQAAAGPVLGEGYHIFEESGKPVISGGRTGILYGAYAYMESLAAGEAIPEGVQQPFYKLRMLDCWDNADGSVERGYSGRSLWFEGGGFHWDPRRIRQLGRMLASAGINVLCVNNVNVHAEARKLIEDAGLPELARFADVLRPFGVRLMVSVSFAQPMRHGIPTADPLDAAVQKWWAERADAVWRAVPDLAGFLVKADSEHRPGPFTYGRSHAEGANMLARAIAPHGGVLVWRAFVYNCMQDWRDTVTDRPMAAYQTYAPLDGRFDDNVILQVKHGPFDFQVREPVSPTLLAMPHTNLALEVQLAQEYTGHQIDLYAMNPMWRELAEDLPPEKVMAVAAVSNLGRDDNFTGHPFAAANLYGYGKYAWDPRVDPEAVLRRWARLTYALPEAQEDALVRLLMDSRDVYEKYTAPLGLCWMVNPGGHYGPSPWGYEFSPLGHLQPGRPERRGHRPHRVRHRLRTAIPGGDPREIRRPGHLPGQAAAVLPPAALRPRHADGRTLIQRIYDDHFEGVRGRGGHGRGPRGAGSARTGPVRGRPAHGNAASKRPGMAGRDQHLLPPPQRRGGRKGPKEESMIDTQKISFENQNRNE